MAKTDEFTIIDSDTVRGVIAPATVLSKEMLTDVIDLLELSGHASSEESADMVRDESAPDAWVTLTEVK